MIEQWRSITGFDGLYEVSSLGRVRNNEHKILRPYKMGKYLGVSLYKGGRQRRYLAHLVAAAFIGPCKLGLQRFSTQVNHKDGNKANNALENLEYVTQVENKAHAVATGLTPQGTRNARAKLTPVQVLEIRSASGTRTQLAAQYNVSYMLIKLIQTRALWKHI